jgi:hypothetical protein
MAIVMRTGSITTDDRGTVNGWVLLSLTNYAWHRSEHAFSPLWRFGHPMHPSPQRVDISGSTLFHPTERSYSLFMTVLVLGLDPVAAASVGYVLLADSSRAQIATWATCWSGVTYAPLFGRLNRGLASP